MSNRRLRMMVKQVKEDTTGSVEILSSEQELSVLGGNCPMLMTCGTYTECTGKYKVTPPLPDIDLGDLISL